MLKVKQLIAPVLIAALLVSCISGCAASSEAGSGSENAVEEVTREAPAISAEPESLPQPQQDEPIPPEPDEPLPPEPEPAPANDVPEIEAPIEEAPEEPEIAEEPPEPLQVLENTVGESAEGGEKSAPAEGTRTYVLNTNTKKFHYPSCASVDKMKEENKLVYDGTHDEIVSMGYSPCKKCNP